MKTYAATLKFIYSFIADRKKLKTESESALEGPKYLLELLGNPQEKLQIIHIAGTSGKGSTSYLTSRLLQSQGFTTGLFLSPHIVDIRERFKLNNKLIPKEEFTHTFKEIIPAIQKVSNSKWGKPSYFVILMAYSFYLFYKRKVDFAIVETGLGGLLDATNIVQNPQKIAVITKIGLDHQWFLGNTLEKIAFQKAGIIQHNNHVITIQQKKPVLMVFKKRVLEKNAKINILNHRSNIKNVVIDKSTTRFDFKFQDLQLPNIQLGLIGYHQAENAAEALASISVAANIYNFSIKKKNIYEALKNVSFPGRFEIIKKGSSEIIIDGAHNPQKMKTFIRSLVEIYPLTKFNFLISFSSGKDQLNTIRGMLQQVVPYAKHIYITEFSLIKQDSNHKAVMFSRIKKVLDKLNYRKYEFTQNADLFITQYSSSRENPLVVTGSLYLISSLYKIINKLKMNPA